MKNRNFPLLIVVLLNFIITSNLSSQEIFNFNVSELEITQNGNLYRGINGGEIITNDGVSIVSDNFEYTLVVVIYYYYYRKNVTFR